MNLRPLIPFATVSLAVGVLAGCGESPAEPSAQTHLTISELLGQRQYNEEDYRENEQRIQEIVADCMAELGWQYIPVTQPDYNYVYDEESELERIRQQGYGIAYWTLNMDNDVPTDGPWDDWVDPNAEYVESLTEAEREAYNLDLYGQMILYSSTRTIVEPDIIIDPYPSPSNGEWDRGCYGEASDEVYGETPSYDDEYWEATNRFYEELNERVLADPRISRLDDEWVSCMAAAGYDYDSPQAVWEVIYPEFQARHDDIVGDLWSRDPFEGWTQQEIDDFWATATQEQIDAMYEDLYVITDSQRTQLEALLADEIEMALTEFECTWPYNQGYQEAYAEIEEEYALEHQAEIEALVASQEG